MAHVHVLKQSEFWCFERKRSCFAISQLVNIVPFYEAGIPYGTVNLRYGVPRGETPVTSTASATTYLMEFGLLSRLTGDAQFEHSARRAITALWNARSRLNLVGGHIDVQRSVWTHRDAGIGTSIDSFYEYLFKRYEKKIKETLLEEGTKWQKWPFFPLFPPLFFGCFVQGFLFMF